MERFVDALANVTVKTSNAWAKEPNFVDPLEKSELAPQAPIPDWEHHGKRWGENVGGVAGSVAGAALPAVAGYSLGSAVGDFAGIPMGAGLAGGALAAPLGMATGPMGGHAGASLGRQIGGALGRGAEHLYSPERRAVNKIRTMDPAKGYAMVRTMRQTQGDSPEADQMSEAYNLRREHFRDRAVATKFSSVDDPLRDWKLGPKASPSYADKGEQIGERVGLGLGVASVAEGNPLGIVAPLAGLSAAPLVGRAAGAIADKLTPRANKMVERIHQMSPAEGWAYIKTVESRGVEDPAVIEAMKDAYNTRRIGVREQLDAESKVSSLGLPETAKLTDPLDDDTAPESVHNWRRPGGMIGAGLSTIAGGVGGAMLGEHLGGSVGKWIGGGLGTAGGYALGEVAGRPVGKAIGSALENLQPQARHDVQEVKDVNPAEAYVAIRDAQRSGKVDPDTLARKQDAYNYRRTGLGYQMAAGVGA